MSIRKIKNSRVGFGAAVALSYSTILLGCPTPESIDSGEDRAVSFEQYEGFAAGATDSVDGEAPLELSTESALDLELCEVFWPTVVGLVDGGEALLAAGPEAALDLLSLQELALLRAVSDGILSLDVEGIADVWNLERLYLEPHGVTAEDLITSIPANRALIENEPGLRDLALDIAYQANLLECEVTATAGELHWGEPITKITAGVIAVTAIVATAVVINNNNNNNAMISFCQSCAVAAQGSCRRGIQQYSCGANTSSSGGGSGSGSGGMTGNNGGGTFFTDSAGTYACSFTCSPTSN